MTEYQLKPGKLGKKVMDGYKKVEEKFTDTFLEKDENSPTGYSLKTGKTAEKVTGAYQKSLCIGRFSLLPLPIQPYQAVVTPCISAH